MKVAPSKSPDRYTFQKESYLERCKKEGIEPDKEYLNWIESLRQQKDEALEDPIQQKNNLEYDLLTTHWILEKVRKNETYAQNLYAALCNNDFTKNEVIPILKDEIWHCSWRYAGGIIADMRQEGDYIDWYCSGNEGTITDEIKKDLLKLGWIVVT